MKKLFALICIAHFAMRLEAQVDWFMDGWNQMYWEEGYETTTSAEGYCRIDNWNEEPITVSLRISLSDEGYGGTATFDAGNNNDLQYSLRREWLAELNMQDEFQMWGGEAIVSYTLPAHTRVIPNFSYERKGAAMQAAVSIMSSALPCVDGLFYSLWGLEAQVEHSYYEGSIEIPETITINGQTYTVTTIGSYAFAGCPITSVKLPNTIKTIGTGAFRNSGLTNVVLPKSIKEIGPLAFADCQKLHNFVFMKSPTITTWDNQYWLNGNCDVHYSIFGTESNGNAINLYTPLSTIEGLAVYCNITVCPSAIFSYEGLIYMVTDASAKTCDVICCEGDPEHITIPATALYGKVNLTVKNIRDNAFRDNNVIHSVVFNNSGTIGYSAFNNCSELTSISLGSSITSIGHSAFNNCSELTSISLGSSITSIENYAFYGNHISTVEIPESVKRVGSYAFFGNNLTDVKVNSDTIGDRAFGANRLLASVVIGENVSTIDGNSVFKSSDSPLKSIEVNPDNAHFMSLNGVLCSKDTTVIYEAPCALSEFSIPSSIQTIKRSAFSDCRLREIIIPSSVCNLERSAFSSCHELQSAVIKQTRTIGEDAFWYCTQLSTLEMDNVESIGASAFYGCEMLTSVTLPHSVVYVGKNAFSQCRKLKELYLGEHLAAIDQEAFRGCSALESITSSNLTPPVCASTAFADVDDMVEISVRDNCLEEYCKTNVWKNFWNIGGYSINYIAKQPTTADPSILMYDTDENVSYQWYEPVEEKIRFSEIQSNLDGWIKVGKDTWSSDYRDSRMNVPVFVKKGDVLSFDYTVKTSPSSSVYFKVQINGISILYEDIDCNKHVDGTCSYTFNSDINDGKLWISVDHWCPHATFSNIRINGKRLAEIGTPLMGATSAVLDPSLAGGAEEAFCVVTLSDGIQLKSDIVGVDSRIHVTKYQGTSAGSDMYLTLEEIQDIEVGENDFVLIDANISMELKDNMAKKETSENYIAHHFELKDAKRFYAPTSVSAESISYNRYFNNTKWQALYVPFSISVDTLTAHGLEVAELNDTHMYDDDEDGVFEKTTIEFLRLKHGNTQANCAYLIKASEIGTVTLEVSNCELSQTVSNSIDCSTFKQKFTVTGTYEGVTGSTMYANNYYAMGDGKLSRVSSADVPLNPMRWFMSIENRDGSPVTFYAPEIRLMIDGEEESNVTGFEEINSEQKETCYYLNGMSKMNRSGMSVRNGRVIFEK